ncbi:4-hydroxythreonine-4-phosphate dehydrogenase [Stella humosa]|uniref:4-hydroxythreonine-4-phosphate dehydrogenase n=1 Tax=Stella humosa TaxID=94 RepID=A0A3N1MEC0_9PROT|nr:4-hydroxythreonine-4-phosphate dehydrogenase PdxA [Stella humosa]ROP99515.1 4-hydroxythreonine-4-phosphate dehydrogenase [Stella humosa]BBK31271.1 4-hydroxythreonine-4-phosphate dehydrogenase 2 [Stella humosa]
MLPLALTMGEPAGIGGEITLRCWAEREPGDAPFFIIDDPARLAALGRRVGFDVPVATIAHPSEAAAVFARALPVLPLSAAPTPTPGRPDPAQAHLVLESIRRAVAAVQDGTAGAVVTNPIQKETLYAAGFRHAGHTEFLAELAGGGVHPIMMLACSELRVVPATVHSSLRGAIDMVSTDLILTAGRITAHALRQDFGIAEPILAVAGLNPHAGENGTLGREELEIIVPAIEILRAEGIDARGPLPADTMFHARARARYDAALCMYHDQALIPLKTIDFDGGVNITLGLPFVRTSPDHGTALDIAGTGVAHAGSLRAAMVMAGQIAARRHAGPVRGRPPVAAE